MGDPSPRFDDRLLEVRDKGNKAMMEDPEMKPFDGKRMIFGGFEVIEDTANA